MALARFCAAWRLHGRRQGFQFPSEYSLSSGYTRKADALRSQLSRNLITSPAPLSYLSSGAEVFVLRRSFQSCSYNASSVVPPHAVKNAGCLTQPCSYKSTEISSSISGVRYMSIVKAPGGARQVSLKLTLLSPGFVYEPYVPRDPIPFWRRWFTPSGWRRTKEDLIMELKSAYAITRLKKVAGYSRKLFYQHALRLYKEINTSLANGDTSSLRKLVTEKMYSTLKNEIKRRDAMWNSVYWELVEPVTRIRTLRARMIGLDKDDLDKAFVQMTLEITAKQTLAVIRSVWLSLRSTPTMSYCEVHYCNKEGDHRTLFMCFGVGCGV
ncbi:uncharacterized protein LOC122016836 isoform X2 [Zingiber officinale]|uniref:uncharacterized protein LOC122016836 isoform X2 n=1 Tax=Zingiber officinale TaxID=94328 RepID=UPI001C4B1A0C|nr:uncharacterized protein LOC122016836 isoform X2 [Zingiber officinale]